MRQSVLLVLVGLNMIAILPTTAFETGQFKWQKNTNFLSISKKKTRTGKHSLLFDVTKDKNPTTRTVQTTFGEQTGGILEGWFLDSPAMRPIWITFGNTMQNSIGVQFGNQANYIARIGGVNTLDTKVARIEGWIGFRLKFTGKKTIFYLSSDEGKKWQEVAENRGEPTFNSIFLRNNQNTGKNPTEAYFDDFRIMDLKEKTVVYEGFGGDVDSLNLNVSSRGKLATTWKQMKLQ